MALIKKISLSNTTYDLGADADNIAYDSNNSVKDKIDDYEEIVPSSASSSNKLATLNDIPSLTNYIEKSQTAGLMKNDGTIDTNTYAQTSALPGAATSSVIGLVKPDETTLTVDANGTMSALSSGGSTISKKRYTITATNWSNSVDADGYYTYTVTLSNPTLDTSYPPNVYLTGADDSTFYTDTEATQYSYLAQCNLTASTTLVLYAKTKPDTTFYVFVEGLEA